MAFKPLTSFKESVPAKTLGWTLGLSTMIAPDAVNDAIGLDDTNVAALHAADPKSGGEKTIELAKADETKSITTTNEIRKPETSGSETDQRLETVVLTRPEYVELTRLQYFERAIKYYQDEGLIKTEDDFKIDVASDRKDLDKEAYRDYKQRIIRGADIFNNPRVLANMLWDLDELVKTKNKDGLPLISLDEVSKILGLRDYRVPENILSRAGAGLKKGASFDSARTFLESNLPVLKND